MIFLHVFARFFLLFPPTSIGTLGVADKFRFIKFKQVNYSPNYGLLLVIIILRHLIFEGYQNGTLSSGITQISIIHWTLIRFRGSGFLTFLDDCGASFDVDTCTNFCPKLIVTYYNYGHL